jgi:MFS family permease
MSGNFKLFLLLSSLFALGSFSYSFLLLYAKQFGFQDSFLPVLYLLFTTMASLFSFPFGRLSDKLGRKSVLALSFVLWGLVCWSFAFAEGYVMVILTFVLYGMHKGALEPVQKSFVSELAPQNYRASGLGVFQLVTGLCALPSSLVAGYLWDEFTPSIPFMLSLSLTVISVVMLLFVRENKSD